MCALLRALDEVLAFVQIVSDLVSILKFKVAFLVQALWLCCSVSRMWLGRSGTCFAASRPFVSRVKIMLVALPCTQRRRWKLRSTIKGMDPFDQLPKTQIGGSREFLHAVTIIRL